ncbi:casein kinase 1, delta [Xylariaceae sp. FL0662B]|nr:casein kinase 1, delta [Xylariaceae sp. FL0662B]
MKDILIDERYRVDRKIGQGGFGMVYSGTDMHTGDEVAIKLTEYSNDDTRQLENEETTYKQLAGEVGVPKIYWIGGQSNYKILILELLGPSLEDLFNYCGRRFSLKTILLLADQIILRVKRIHRHFLHHDIKPENFLLGTGKMGNTLYTIDFGLARTFSDEETDEGLPFGGTGNFASINNHNGQEQSWGDDLECVGYMFVYFARGYLLWEGMERDLVKEQKINLSGKELCRGILPDEFADFIDYTRSLGFGKKPDYRYLRNLFRRRFKSEGFNNDNVFDWTRERFNELHEQASQWTKLTAASPAAREWERHQRRSLRKL